MKPEETETPFALPKPKIPGESIVFNFSKVIPMDKTNHSHRRKMLTKILSQDPSKEDTKLSKEIVFSLGKYCSMDPVMGENYIAFRTYISICKGVNIRHEKFGNFRENNVALKKSCN